VVGAFAGRFLQRIAPRLTVGLGLLLIAAGNLLQARIDTGSTGAILIPGLIVTGVGIGCVLPANASAVLAEVPLDRSGMAGGTLNTFRQLGLAFGVAVSGTVFTDRIAAGRLRRRAERNPAGRRRNRPGR
jgi:MFS family permease